MVNKQQLASALIVACITSGAVDIVAQDSDSDNTAIQDAVIDAVVLELENHGKGE